MAIDSLTEGATPKLLQLCKQLARQLDIVKERVSLEQRRGDLLEAQNATLRRCLAFQQTTCESDNSLPTKSASSTAPVEISSRSQTSPTPSGRVEGGAASKAETRFINSTSWKESLEASPEKNRRLSQDLERESLALLHKIQDFEKASNSWCRKSQEPVYSGWQDIRKTYFPDGSIDANEVKHMYSGHWMELRQKIIQGVKLWTADRALLCASVGEEHLFREKAHLLKNESSIRGALDRLNTLEGHVACPEGYCVVFSKRVGEYFFLSRSDKCVALDSLPEVSQTREANNGCASGSLDTSRSAAKDRIINLGVPGEFTPQLERTEHARLEEVSMSPFPEEKPPELWLPNGFCDLQNFLVGAGRGLATTRLREADVEAFFRSVGENDVEAVQSALSDSMDLLNAKHPDTLNHPLHEAIAAGAVQVTECLLEAAQRYTRSELYKHSLEGERLRRNLRRIVNATNAHGRSPLADLVRLPAANKDIFFKLLEAKADLTTRDSQGMTPFLECARTGNVDLMKVLLHATDGALLGETDGALHTALHCAAQWAKTDMVELLMKVKANHEAIDAGSRTPADVAQANGHEEIFRLLSSLSLHPEDEQVGANSNAFEAHLEGIERTQT